VDSYAARSVEDETPEGRAHPRTDGEGGAPAERQATHAHLAVAQAAANPPTRHGERRAARPRRSGERVGTRTLPRLAFVFRPHSFSPLVLPAAAAGVCELVWVIDSSDPETVAFAPLLERLGGTVDIAGLAAEDAAAVIARRGPQGILALADNRLEWTAQVAAWLEVPFMSPRAAACATDKYRQRVVMRDAGLPGPDFHRVPALGDDAAWARLAAVARFPAVLKPRRSEASHNTLAVDSARHARAALSEMFADTGEQMTAMILEEFLAAAPGAGGEGFASYLSIESVASAGSLSHVAISGRTPLVTPFRETGAFVPAAIGAEEAAAVVGLARAAAEAIGIEVGCLHTEIQLTPEGPRVIEVNGRIGGIPGVIAAATGVDMRAVAMRVALGERVVFETLPPTSGVGFRLDRYADAPSGRLLAVDGIDALGADPHIEEVILRRAPGQHFDWREGTDGGVVTIGGRADDHEHLRRIATRLATEVTITVE
jgi:glutathione synthase/RimK-type ligase-like ATP-grasp enzyme